MKIRIGFFAVMLGLSLVLSHSLFSLAAFLAALFHELGHLVAARICHIRFGECKVGLFGAGLVPSESLFSYRREICLCAAGPLSNFLLAAVTYPFLLRSSSDFPRYLIFSSLALGMLNTLPIQDFDGGRILQALLLTRLSERTVNRMMSILSFLCIFFLWSSSVYLLLRAASSLSLFIFSLSLFFRIFIPNP